jgi:hypothetical protein
MLDDYQYREEFHEILLKSLIKMSNEIDLRERKYKQIIRNSFALLISINAINQTDLEG